MKAGTITACSKTRLLTTAVIIGAWSTTSAHAQLTDTTQTPNTADAGIHKSFEEQIGAGRGDILTPGSSMFIIK